MVQFSTPPSAIVFDLDGTLIDSRGDVVAACNHVLRCNGREPLPIERLRDFTGDGARSLLSLAFQLPRNAPEIETLFLEWQRYYVAHPTEHTRLLPSAASVVELLSERAALAVATNKARPVAIAILDALGLRPHFAAVYAGGDGPLKPRPEPILAMAAALRVSLDEVWVVGDGVQDIEAAHAAGAQSIAITAGFHSEARLRAAAPTKIVASLGALVDLLV